jgi:hypothetical protein
MPTAGTRSDLELGMKVLRTWKANSFYSAKHKQSRQLEHPPVGPRRSARFTRLEHGKIEEMIKAYLKTVKQRHTIDVDQTSEMTSCST